MSYNTAEILEAHNLDISDFENLELSKKKELFYEALQKQLPLGMQWIENTITEFKNGKREDGTNRLIATEDPHSETGKQAIRLFFDIPRSLIEERHGIAIGSYNCCKAVIGYNKDDLDLSLDEQFRLQSTPDC
jgi:hypothetical protein